MQATYKTAFVVLVLIFGCNQPAPVSDPGRQPTVSMTIVHPKDPKAIHPREEITFSAVAKPDGDWIPRVVVFKIVDGNTNHGSIGARLETPDREGNYNATAKLKAPRTPGKYTVFAFFQGVETKQQIESSRQTIKVVK